MNSIGPWGGKIDHEYIITRVANITGVKNIRIVTAIKSRSGNTGWNFTGTSDSPPHNICWLLPANKATLENVLSGSGNDVAIVDVENGIKLVSKIQVGVDPGFSRVNNDVKLKSATKITKAELTIRAKLAPKKPRVRSTNTDQYERDPYVAEYALMRACGKCELCGMNAPFVDSHGEPFLESHHIIWLSNGGDDTIDNAVALCPNCHRKVHVIPDAADIKKLSSIKKIIDE